MRRSQRSVGLEQDASKSFGRLLPWVSLVAAVVIAACGSGSDPEATANDGAVDPVHVHEVLSTPSGDTYVATHTGLFRVDDDGLELAGSSRHDLMSAAVTPEGAFVASGHPELRSDDLRVEGKPPLLGLVASDTGEEWKPVSLLGDADLHGIEIVDGTIYAADSTGARIRVSDDGGRTWDVRAGEAQLVAFAVDPGSPDDMVGVDLDRGLVTSADGGDSWDAIDGPPFVDLEWADGGLVGLTEDGEVFARDPVADSWTDIDAVTGVDALGTSSDGSVLALTLPNTIQRSDDGGRTWTD